VPGVLLGGGINFFGSQYGWTSNMVSNFEVVLANSSIVNANAQTNRDLFWALKGDSSNFGIVTRFDIKTFPATSMYDGTTVYESQSVKEYLDAIANYVVSGGGSDDILASINPTLQINVNTSIFTINTISSHVGPDPNPTAFANFTKIPANFSDNNVRPNFSAFTDETSSPVYGQRSNRYDSPLYHMIGQRRPNNLKMAICINGIEGNSGSRPFNQSNLLCHHGFNTCTQERHRTVGCVHASDYHQGLVNGSEGLRRRCH